MEIGIASALIDRILAEAAADPSHEVCGLLFGGEGGITGAVAAANVAGNPASAFEVDPVVLFAAIRAERAGGPRLAGVYHSHPNGSAEPSVTDAEMAQDGHFWLIVAGGMASLWRAVPGGRVAGRFESVAMHLR